jgi:hypothetical protein
MVNDLIYCFEFMLVSLNISCWLAIKFRSSVKLTSSAYNYRDKEIIYLEPKYDRWNAYSRVITMHSAFEFESNYLSMFAHTHYKISNLRSVKMFGLTMSSQIRDQVKMFGLTMLELLVFIIQLKIVWTIWCQHYLNFIVVYEL